MSGLLLSITPKYPDDVHALEKMKYVKLFSFKTGEKK